MEHTITISAQRSPRARRRLHIPAVAVAERVHHDKHVLLWQARGATQLTLDGQQRRLNADYVLWVPAGVRHSMQVQDESVLLPMFFGLEETATTLRGVQILSVDRQLRTLFLAQVQTQNSIIRPPADISRQILSLLEEQPLLGHDLPMPRSEAARQIADGLRFNPGDGRSTADLAASVHTSERTIERAFLAETTMTLRQWRIANRMEAAGTLLRSETAIPATAQRVGYSNVSSFGRAFKNHHGMTPTQYMAVYARGS